MRCALHLSGTRPAHVTQADLSGHAYHAWFRAKIEKALADPRPSIPHVVVMAQVQALLDRRKKPQD